MYNWLMLNPICSATKHFSFSTHIYRIFPLVGFQWGRCPKYLCSSMHVYCSQIIIMMNGLWKMCQQHIPKMLKTFDEVCWICTNGQLLKWCGSAHVICIDNSLVVICSLIPRPDPVKSFADVLMSMQKQNVLSAQIKYPW